MRATMTTTHRYDLPMARHDVWTLISDVENYRRWWSWLRVFEARALAPGEEWHCEVQPPVPYPVRFDVALEEVHVAAFVAARVGGDVRGRATLTLEDAPVTPGGAPGSVATLRSALSPANAALRQVARLAFPVARFGHDWVMDAGARQFIASVESATPGTPGTPVRPAGATGADGPAAA